jgi:hypothetical protein
VWQINSQLPDSLCYLIDQLLEKRPNKRPASASEVKDRLLRTLQRTQSHHPGLWTRCKRVIHRRGKAIAAVALLVVLSIGLFTWLQLLGGNALFRSDALLSNRPSSQPSMPSLPELPTTEPLTIAPPSAPTPSLESPPRIPEAEKLGEIPPALQKTIQSWIQDATEFQSQINQLEQELNLFEKQFQSNP